MISTTRKAGPGRIDHDVDPLGDAEAADSGGPVAKLASLPYELTIEAEETVVGRAGVARMNAGHLHQLPHAMPAGSAVLNARSTSESPTNPAATAANGNDPISVQQDVPSPPGEGVIEGSVGTISQEPSHAPRD